MRNERILFMYRMVEMERWLSGLKRLPAKQESGKLGARVRIPLSPPKHLITLLLHTRP
jgi:hypothetical protein